ncbi:hypothetical protein HYR99_15835 [Candidatus Poribacteria bacterium]|nr:hypothetical protein [Candidatus Poribacteria bacterium]
MVLDLFGGVTSQIRGAVNVDKIAAQGVRADIGKGLPFRSRSVNEIIASGPRAVFLDEAARVLKIGGKIVINATAHNGFRFGTRNGGFPSQQELDTLGLRVVQRFGVLPSQFSHLVFRLTNGTPIPNLSVKTTIFEKIK